ncbi:hypothetical protein TrRE_jg3235 [Triparma retinervis]|uniref:Uncharacterized protein n=1 Tax=Triparma retinervis TaxID=2557542 RepID=A0A9W7ACK4_9STRA|nr:hypothetical protein TrRE_jg3235 [Triparma retinervis]
MNQNCVNKCVSPECFDEVYGPSTPGPLEDGESDPERQKLFTSCVRRDYREQKRKREMARRAERDKKKSGEDKEQEGGGGEAGEIIG